MKMQDIAVGGKYVVKVGELPTLVHFVGAIFPYSTRRFLFAYPAERQECLFDAMERVYQRAGGVTEVATLDNTALAVKKVLEGLPLPPEALVHERLHRIKEVPEINPLNPKYAMIIKLWQRLPLSIANTLGPLIARELA
jgi:hypothetical protein